MTKREFLKTNHAPYQGPLPQSETPMPTLTYRDLRILSGLSLEEAAEGVGLSVEDIRDLEEGRITHDNWDKMVCEFYRGGP